MIPLQDDNPTELTPVVTVTFIVLCVLVFIYQASLPPQQAETLVFQYGAIPALLFGHADLPLSIAVGIPSYMTLLSSMFMHGGWMHLIGNMLYLWIFGNNVEDVMGHARFVVFYLICGVLAALSHAVTAGGASSYASGSHEYSGASPSLAPSPRITSATPSLLQMLLGAAPTNPSW